MKQLVEDLRSGIDAIDNIEELSDEEQRALYAKQLDGVKENVELVMKIAPDQVAVAISPYLHLEAKEGKGEAFFRHCDIFADDFEAEMPCWGEIQEMGLFQLNGESEFIRSLSEIDEKCAVKIILATGFVKLEAQRRGV